MHTSFKADIASTTSFVKVLPAPDDPINIVGFMVYQNTTDEMIGTLHV